MKRVAITGADGIVGSAIRSALADFVVTPVRSIVTDGDADAYRPLVQVLDRQDAVIHLAWSRVMGRPELGADYLKVLPTDNRHFNNLEMTDVVIRAAQQSGVRRLILASSVRADDFESWEGPGLLSPNRSPRPIGPYGAAKVLLEEQGRFAASLGLEVVCIRLGHVTPSGDPHPTDQSERRVWLSHRDCSELIRACLVAPTIPGGFCVVYAVSNNDGRVHDTQNPLGWQERDCAVALSDLATSPRLNSGVGCSGKVNYTRRADETATERAIAVSAAKEHNRGLVDRLLQLLLADFPTVHQINRLEHGLQTATRALRDGADEETIVCALFHDAADYFTTENHAGVIAELLRPYISPENHWMVAMHGEFTYGNREKYRDHPCFERTLRFVESWDNESFDPTYDTLGLETFEPMVRRILSRPPYQFDARDDIGE
jgi:predicted HD phosphohydrolase